MLLQWYLLIVLQNKITRWWMTLRREGHMRRQLLSGRKTIGSSPIYKKHIERRRNCLISKESFLSAIIFTTKHREKLTKLRFIKKWIEFQKHVAFIRMIQFLKDCLGIKNMISKAISCGGYNVAIIKRWALRILPSFSSHSQIHMLTTEAANYKIPKPKATEEINHCINQLKDCFSNVKMWLSMSFWPSNLR